MKKQFKIYVLLALLVAIGSEVHFYPFNSLFRVSLGVIILNVVLLVREDIDGLSLSLLSGFTIFIERLVTSTLMMGIAYEYAFLNGFPALSYYIVYGLLFRMIRLKPLPDGFFQTFMGLALIDSVSNISEALMRHNLSDRTLMVIVVVALIRAFIAYGLYFTWQRNALLIQKQEHQKRYGQLNMLVANVEAELFYLKKSSKDIERVMGECYGLYASASPEDENKNKLLTISKDIHEIKKDYLRVLNGFHDFVDHLEGLDDLRVSEIFNILKTNYGKTSKVLKKEIKFHYEQEGNPLMPAYLSVFTILNNLVDNSITACGRVGDIRVIYREKEKHHEFMVMDNGCGMTDEETNLIFNPGYTTKYDEETGRASTGIGLTHVKNMVETLEGQIEVTSEIGRGTRFRVWFEKTPEDMLKNREVAEDE